jgi:hypothetical protein
LEVLPAATAIDCVAETAACEVPLFATEVSLLHEAKKSREKNAKPININPECFVFILYYLKSDKIVLAQGLLGFSFLELHHALLFTSYYFLSRYILMIGISGKLGGLIKKMLIA